MSDTVLAKAVLDVSAIKVDRQLPTALYKQLRQSIECLIMNGTAVPGMFLPPGEVMAEAVGVDVNTVNKAYHELKLLKLVRRVPGKGLMVVELEPETKEHLKTVRESLMHQFTSTAAQLRFVGVSNKDLQQALKN